MISCYVEIVRLVRPWRDPLSILKKRSRRWYRLSRVETVRQVHTYPDGFLFLYLLSLLVSYLQVAICWKAGRKGAGEVFMEEGLCLSCTCNPNSRIFAVIRFTNTYRFSASSDDFSRSKTNQESGEVLQTFCYVLNIEVSFSTSHCRQLFIRRTFDGNGSWPTYYGEEPTKILPSKHHAIFRPRTPRNSKNRMLGATRWALP